MASGTVIYKSDMLFPHREIYNGTSAQDWPVHIESGKFPANPYKVNKAVIKFDVRTAYASDRHMVISRGGGDGVEQFGDVPTGTPGVHTENLLTTASYEGISAIHTDGVDRWACQLRGSSYIEIVIDWEETEAKEEKAEEPKPVVVTGKVKNGKSGYATYSGVSVSFDGVDISTDINKNLLTLSYTDNEEDEADDLQIKLHDADAKWLQKWLNDTVQKASFGAKKGTKGLSINAGVSRTTPSGKKVTANFGTFELDSIKASGPPSQITIKGTSLPYAGGIRTDERDKSWEKYKLSGIGAEIAKKAGLSFMYDCPTDPSYDRVEQAKQTDIAFLMQLCHENGFSLKAYNRKLIIFDQSKYENLAPVGNIVWMDGTYTKYDLQTQDGEVHYDECQVKYYHPVQKKLYEGVARAEDYDNEAADHTVCVVSNRAVKSDKEAEKLAKKILRLHNKFEKCCSFTLIGNPMLGSGMTMTVQQFGLWDGTYIISQCKHEIGASGYTTKVKLRTLPEGTVKKVTTEKTDDSSSGGGSGKGGKGTGTYEWRTTRGCAVYKAPTDTMSIGSIPKDKKITLLGNVKNGRTLVTDGTWTGYVQNDAFKRVEVKK